MHLKSVLTRQFYCQTLSQAAGSGGDETRAATGWRCEAEQSCRAPARFLNHANIGVLWEQGSNDIMCFIVKECGEIKAEVVLELLFVNRIYFTLFFFIFLSCSSDKLS